MHVTHQRGSICKAKHYFICYIKGALCSLGEEIQTQNLDIYSIIEVITQTHTDKETRCSQREIRSPEHCLKLKRWLGPPNINKVKQYEIVLSCLSIKKIKLSLPIPVRRYVTFFLQWTLVLPRAHFLWFTQFHTSDNLFSLSIFHIFLPLGKKTPSMLVDEVRHDRTVPKIVPWPLQQTISIYWLHDLSV